MLIVSSLIERLDLLDGVRLRRNINVVDETDSTHSLFKGRISED